MPILLKTRVERTAKTPIQACHARVGALCGFHGTAERVPTGSPKTGRCANVRERRGNDKSRKNACGQFSAEEEAASGEAGERTDAFLRPTVHFCPQCGQFRGFTKELLSGQKSTLGVVI